MALCGRCKGTYEDIYEGCKGNQGYGCAASVVEQGGDVRIAAGYGSKFDLCLIKMVDRKKAGVAIGMEVCDACISKLIASKVAIHDHSLCERIDKEREDANERGGKT